MELFRTEVEFQPLHGERYAMFCEGASSLDAVELVQQLLEQLGWEPFDEHFFNDKASESALRKSLDALTLRGKRNAALVLIPGLTTWLISGRESANEVQVLAYLFRMAKEVAGVSVPVLVPVHTESLDLNRNVLERGFGAVGFKRLRVSFDDLEGGLLVPLICEDEIDAAVRMSGVVQAAEETISQSRREAAGPPAKSRAIDKEGRRTRGDFDEVR